MTEAALTIPPDLPPPEGEARAHGERVARHLAALIEAKGGAIGFDRFMAEALYAPGLGYYAAGARKFGAAGDFVTAPELSPLFSRTLARQVAEILAELPGGEVVEAGAGSGVMARDLLLELERLGALPPRYAIVEVSPDLRQRQRQTLADGAPHLLERVVWLDDLPPPGFRGVVVGNEVLDAMPVHLVRRGEAGWQERCVGLERGRFVWRDAPLHHPDLRRRIERLERELGADTFIPGYTTEINLAADGWLASLAERLTEGVILLIDYGFPQHEFYHPERTGGTLMCHYRHRAHPDPLVLPGLQDITAHVDFTALAHAGIDSGLDLLGFTPQAHFLIGAGLGEVAALDPEGEIRHHLDQTAQIKKLTLPSEMGELFKAIAFGKNFEAPLRGFMLADQRHRL